MCAQFVPEKCRVAVPPFLDCDRANGLLSQRLRTVGDALLTANVAMHSAGDASSCAATLACVQRLSGCRANASTNPCALFLPYNVQCKNSNENVG